MAVAEGFEPSEGGYPSHAFEACSLGRSDTPPLVTVPEYPGESEIAWTETQGRWARKKASRVAAQSDSRMPPRTSGR
jgi:hypothetical protein